MNPRARRGASRQPRRGETFLKTRSMGSWGRPGMLSRFRSIVLVCLLATVFATSAFASPARASLAVPVWSAGDFWLYDITGLASPQPGTTGPARSDVLGTESVTVSGISYTAYHAKLTFNVTLGSISLTMLGFAWFRTSDLSPVKMTFSASFGGTTLTVTLTYNPPIAIQWPLTANASWSASSVVTTVTEITGQQPTTATATLLETIRVEADEQKTVPAGTFTTTPVVQTEGGVGPAPYTKSYWSRDAGNQVEQKSYDQNDAETGGMELRSYRHVAPSGGPSGGVLGLPPIIWALFLLVVVIIVIAAIVMRRRRPTVPAGYMPVAAPPMQQPPPPQQLPPSMPPSQPGGPYPPPP